MSGRPGPGRQRRGSDASRGAARGRWRCQGDHGSSSVEFALLFPVIVMVLFAGPQLAMWYFARQAAEAAAQAGARAASADGAGTGAGPAAADSYLTQVGSVAMTSHTVTERNTPTTVTIAIHAEVPNVLPLPGFSPTVTVTVVRPKERFTTPRSP